MMLQRKSVGFGLALGVILTMLAATAPAAPPPDFVLTGGAGACVAPATPITNGCQLLIAGPYTDAAGNDFTIMDVSTSNKARIEFVESSLDKLILTGVTIKALEPITNARLTFKHQSTSTKFDEPLKARDSLSGGFTLLFPNGTARNVQAMASAEVCQVGVGCLTPDGTPFASTPVQGNIAAGQTVASYAPTPTEQFYCGDTFCSLGVGYNSNGLLRGQITISSLKTNERTTNITHTLLFGPVASLPPFTGPGACDGDEDIGMIVRGVTPEQDTVCVKTSSGSFQLMAGAEALQLSSVCPVGFEEQVNGLNFEKQILQFYEKSTSGF